MHDVKALRDDPDRFVRGWSSRGLDGAGLVAELRALDERVRAAQTAFQTGQARRNEASKLIGQAKAKKDDTEAARLMAEVEALKGALAEAETEEKRLSKERDDRLAALPNLPAEDVPEGADEHGNVEQKRVGDPDDKEKLPAAKVAAPKDHADLGEALRLMDFEAAARMSGARFVVLKGQLARLERALGQFMLDLQTTEHGYLEVNPPLLVRDHAMFGTGQLPKFEEDLFKTTVVDWDEGERHITQSQANFWETEAWRMSELLTPFYEDESRSKIKDSAGYDAVVRASHSLWLQVGLKAYDEFRRTAPQETRYLIPTAEVSLTNLVREQITPEDELPLRLTALTPCFRAEAGSAGRDTRGMIRQHQFSKVELVSITTPEQSDAEHERMTACAEAVLERLHLPYRRMLLCTGDMGFSARKTYDLEVWLPSQKTYREISSCSNCGDFQALRMDARSRAPGGKPRPVHTLNGSGLAVGRTLVAVLENYQDEAGRITVPDALVPYMGGVTTIGGAQ